MKILILTTSGFAPTHTPKLLDQVEYTNSFSDTHVIVKKDITLSDLEYLIMTEGFDCVYPTTVFEYSENHKHILSFNKRQFQILEYHNQAYIGSGIHTHMLLNDKALTNLKSGMALPGKVVTKHLWANKMDAAIDHVKNIPLPVIIKPNTLAASLGISRSAIAYKMSDISSIIQMQFSDFPYLSELLVEHYLENSQEYTISVTGNQNKNIYNITSLISQTQTHEMFSYENKNSTVEKRTLQYGQCSSMHVKYELIKKAKQLINLFNTRDYARFDFLLDTHGQIHLIDANSLPSLGSNYLYQYVLQGEILEKQIFSLLLAVFCLRVGLPLPKCAYELSSRLMQIIM